MRCASQRRNIVQLLQLPHRHENLQDEYNIFGIDFSLSVPSAVSRLPNDKHARWAKNHARRLKYTTDRQDVSLPRNIRVHRRGSLSPTIQFRNNIISDAFRIAVGFLILRLRLPAVGCMSGGQRNK